MHHPDPDSFAVDSQKFSQIGGIVVGLSRLELAHDELITAIFNRSKTFALAIANTFPRHFEPKTDFVINALISHAPLRQMPIFDDGYLNLAWLQYQLDELYDLRAVLAHGAISYSEEHDTHTVWYLERTVKGSQKGDWCRVRTKVGSRFLADASYTSDAIRKYFGNLKSFIETDFQWETHYQDQKSILKNRAMLKELFDIGAVARPSGCSIVNVAP